MNAGRSIAAMLTSLSAVLLLAACSAQDTPACDGAPSDPRVDPQRPDSAAQLAEYVVAAFEDSRGNLWFGTNGQGVACYTPSSSRERRGALRYLSVDEGLIGDVVTDIAEDRKGRLWFGTHTGATRYDPSAADSTGRRTFTGFGAAEGLRGSGCKLLVDREGTVWAGTSEGAFRLEGERFDEFDLPTPTIAQLSYKIVAGKVWDLREDSQGNIWFARDGYGACRYDPSRALGPGAFMTFTREDGLCSNNVARIVEDTQGNIWFGAITSDHPEPIAEGGLSRYDPSTALVSGRPALTQFPDLKGLTNNDIYNLYVDRSGHVWIGAVRVGAYRFDPSPDPGDRPFTLFDRTDRPDLTTTFGVQAMLEDSHGTLWFGFSGGLFRFNGRSFLNVTRGGPWTGP